MRIANDDAAILNFDLIKVFSSDISQKVTYVGIFRQRYLATQIDKLVLSQLQVYNRCLDVYLMNRQMQIDT